MSPIKEPYLLCVCVPVSIDGEGRRWTDELWAKDLELHLEYLDDLTLASPAVQEQPRERDVCLNQPPFDRLKYIDLPYPRSYGAHALGFARIRTQALEWSTKRFDRAFGVRGLAHRRGLAPHTYWQAPEETRRDQYGELVLAAQWPPR